MSELEPVTKTVKLTIDNTVVEVPEGTSVLEAARKIGADTAPPAMCYYSKLEGSGGKCRTCLVRIAQTSTKEPRPQNKLAPSCRTLVQEGMVVENNSSAEVLEARKGVVELLLINHPLDCPICDQAGECDLQNLAFEHGAETTNYEEDRRRYPVKDIGDLIKLHMNRCILCYRCVYVADQLTDQRHHGVLWRGDAAEIGTYIQTAITNDFSGNMIDVCPVGALTDKTFRFKSRVWFTRPLNAHRNCPTCCGKTVVWLKGNEVLRVTARKTLVGEVVDFICNTCRFEKKHKDDWVLEGPTHIARTSVISQNHYETVVRPQPQLKGPQ
ncbi:MAG: 2Fe-2S iron-sulfur cluster-binding protein [Candidatus Margulisiibacteriota bacterium]